MPGADDWRNWAMVSLLGLIWGSAFTTTGLAVQSVAPLTLAAARLVVAASALLILAFIWGGGLPNGRTAEGRRAWRQAAITAAAANAIPFALLAWAQGIVSSALAGVYMATLPLIVLPLAHVFVPAERMTAPKVIGFAIGSMGLVTLIGWDVLSEVGGASLEVLAQIACVLAAAGYAIGSVASKLAPPTHPFSFGAATLLLAALMASPAALLVEAPLEQGWTPAALASTLWLGLGPTALAIVVLLSILRRAGPTFLTMVNYQVPLWAMALGMIFLGERIPDAAPLALALILSGVAVSQGAAGWLWRRLAS